MTGARTGSVLGLLLFLAACAGAGGPPSAAPAPADDQAIPAKVLEEARWRPLPEVVSDGREVIRVASVFALVSRSYVQVVKHGPDVSLQLSDAVGNAVSGPLSLEQWDRLVAESKRARGPVDQAAAARNLRRIIRQTGHCHGWDQAEVFVQGQSSYAFSSVCEGEATRPAQNFAAEVKRTALQLFPVCSAGAGDADVVTALSNCPSTLRRRASSQ